MRSSSRARMQVRLPLCMNISSLSREQSQVNYACALLLPALQLALRN